MKVCWNDVAAAMGELENNHIGLSEKFTGYSPSYHVDVEVQAPKMFSPDKLYSDVKNRIGGVFNGALQPRSSTAKTFQELGRCDDAYRRLFRHLVDSELIASVPNVAFYRSLFHEEDASVTLVVVSTQLLTRSTGHGLTERMLVFKLRGR